MKTKKTKISKKELAKFEKARNEGEQMFKEMTESISTIKAAGIFAATLLSKKNQEAFISSLISMHEYCKTHRRKSIKASARQIPQLILVFCEMVKLTENFKSFREALKRDFERYRAHENILN